jgi:hypothetical protein
MRSRGRLLLGTALLLGCGSGKPELPAAAAAPAPAERTHAPRAGAADARVLAWVDGEPLDVEAVGAGAQSGGEEAKQALKRAIDRRLLADEARRRGVEDELWVREQLARVRAETRRAEEEILVDALAAELLGDDAAAEPALRELFDADPARFARPRYTLRLSRHATREAAELAAKTLAETGFLAETRFEDLGPAFGWELPDWLRAQVGTLDAPGRRLVVEQPDGFVLVELAALELAPPPSYEPARDELLRAARRGLAGDALLRELERLREQREIRIAEDAS